MNEKGSQKFPAVFNKVAVTAKDVKCHSSNAEKKHRSLYASYSSLTTAIYYNVHAEILSSLLRNCQPL